MLSIDFINVGYGDAILIQDQESNYSMLVDCGDISIGDGGPKSCRISAADFLAKASINHLDLLVLTHLHRDHCGGLLDVLKQVTVSEFWCNYLPDKKLWGNQIPVDLTLSAGAVCLMESLNIFLKALDIMDDQETIIKLYQKSAAKDLTPQLHAEIGLPEEAMLQKQAHIWSSTLQGKVVRRDLDALDGFINNTSIRLRVDYGRDSVELPGDTYGAYWETYQLSPCTILKMPHHGHEDAATPKLLQMLQPKQVVISVSNTRTDNCPAPELIRQLRAGGAEVFITDAVSLFSAPPVYHTSVHFDLNPTL